jgi:hypothetical protein
VLLWICLWLCVLCFNNGDLIALSTKVCIFKPLFAFISVLSAALTARTFYTFCSTLQCPPAVPTVPNCHSTHSTLQYPTVTLARAVPTVPQYPQYPAVPICSTHSTGTAAVPTGTCALFLVRLSSPYPAPLSCTPHPFVCMFCSSRITPFPFPV